MKNYGQGRRITVALLLDGKQISSDWLDIDNNERD